MVKQQKIPNKKTRTIILGVVLLIYTIMIVYVAITGKNNNLDGKKIDDIFVEEEYEYDDEYNEENEEIELSIYSDSVQDIYTYIKNFPYVYDLKDTFKVSDLTEEEKMHLVMASLKSRNVKTNQPVVDVGETQIFLNNIYYYAQQPNVRYDTYEVMSMYDDLFGTTANFSTATLMYDGQDIVYKYNESVSGYIKYINLNQVQEETKETAELTKAIRKGKELKIYIENNNVTEVYIFEEIYGYDGYYTYKFVGRTTNQEKNSL